MHARTCLRVLVVVCIKTHSVHSLILIFPPKGCTFSPLSKHRLCKKVQRLKRTVLSSKNKHKTNIVVPGRRYRTEPSTNLPSPLAHLSYDKEGALCVCSLNVRDKPSPSILRRELLLAHTYFLHALSVALFCGIYSRLGQRSP